MNRDTSPTEPAALEMRGITKRYPGVVANDHIDLDVCRGEIHALLGENGAGKTTLMNVLYGLARPDAGQILLDGRQVRISGPADAIARGISMVHQHFMLIPVLTVAENVILGAETMANPVFVDRREADRRIGELARRFGFDLDPDARVSTLSVGLQQRVEILKALYREARILVLDEPTAVLTPQETEEIFALLRRLAADGRSIIFISHKLYEVLEVADRITVIRRGKVIGERKPGKTTEEELAELMVGRQVELTVDRGVSHVGGPVLRVENLRVADDRRHEVVPGVSFEIRAGEILGVAGVAGNGQDELVEAIVGLRRPAGGTVVLDGREVTGNSPRHMNEAGVGYVPADRHRFGLIRAFPLYDNLVLTSYYRSPFARSLGPPNLRALGRIAGPIGRVGQPIVRPMGRVVGRVVRPIARLAGAVWSAVASVARRVAAPALRPAGWLARRMPRPVFVRDDGAIKASAESQVEKFDIRTPSIEVPASTLSGGNQQKLIVAREFDRPLKLLVLDQPTRGLDVGSIEFIHEEIIKKRDAGTAVLLVSAELDEVMEMSDRIAVMYRGRIVADLDGRTADKSEVGLYMATGGHGMGEEATA